jgi:cell wall-associated NlpC family hydrolase
MLAPAPVPAPAPAPAHTSALGLVLTLCLSLLGCASTTPHPIPAASFATRGEAVVAYAEAQLGRPYCWGGSGPGCFDCSGLVGQAYAAVGVRLPRSSRDMGLALAEVPLDEMRPGDILWWPGHVGIYAGSGWSIEALDSRHGVVRRPASNPRRALRPPGVD